MMALIFYAVMTDAYLSACTLLVEPSWNENDPTQNYRNNVRTILKPIDLDPEYRAAA
jgi:hypothetical protein